MREHDDGGSGSARVGSPRRSDTDQPAEPGRTHLRRLDSRRPHVPVPLWLALATALAPAPALAQRYFVHTYSETDGLPSSTTNGLAQDADGYMWFATRSGIARYDGVDWTPYSTADGLDSPDQFGLALDEAGTLWAAGAAAPFSLASFGEGRWHDLPGSPPPGPVGERTTGFAVTRSGDRTLAALATTERRLFVWDGTRWARLDPSPELELGRAPRVAGCGGRLYVTTERGLASIAAGPTAPALEVFEGMPSPELRGVAAERKGNGSCRVWLAGKDWLGHVEDAELTLVAEGVATAFGPGYEFLTLEPDGEGGAFVGNPLGLRHVDARGEVEELTPRSGLIANGATSVLVDRENDVWIGSLRGVSKIASFRFATYDKAHGLLENEVTAVLESRTGAFVLGHARGLTVLDKGEVRTLILERDDVPAGSTRVLDLAEDAVGTIWVAASGLGLARFEPGGAVRWHMRESAPAVVHSVLVDRGGTVWALGSGAVFEVTPRGFERVEGGPTHDSRRLFEGAAGRLYVATGGDGLYQRSGGRWIRWDVGEGAANDVFAVLEGPGEELWIGTAAGLFVRRAGRVERALLGGAAVERRVYFLARDDRDRLWIGTDNGVLRWSPEALELRHFTVLDGLAGRETNRAAGVVDSRGRVWIGTEQGVSVYDGARERRDPVAPRPDFRFLEANGQRYPLDQPVRLGQGRGDLLFDFRTPSFVDETRLRYRSRLEGYEASWSAPFAATTIRYTNLSPGEYRLHLQAASAGEPWGAPISSARIVIPMPFWGSPFFYALLAAIGAWGLYLVQGYAAQKRYSQRLEADVRERTAELSQVNADLRAEATERERAESELERLIRELEARNAELETFTYTVSHDLKSPLVTIEGFVGWLERHVARGDSALVARDLELIRSSTRKMALLLDELLRLSRVGRVANKPELVPLEELVHEAELMVAGEIAERGVQLSLAPDLPRVFGDRARLLQVLQNLLKNAVRFSGDRPDPRIEISARQDASEIVCCVRDNGIGIEPEYHERVFRLFERLDPKRGGTGLGLAIAERILSAHGGRIWIESEGSGRGTTACFALPRPEADRGPQQG